MTDTWLGIRGWALTARRGEWLFGGLDRFFLCVEEEKRVCNVHLSLCFASLLSLCKFWTFR